MSHKIITIARSSAAEAMKPPKGCQSSWGFLSMTGIWWRWPPNGWDILL